jgi:hypothetical protein
MASNSESTIDWYLISVDKLRKIGIVLIVLAVAGGGWLYRDLILGSPKSRAESAIRDAEQSLNQLAAAENFQEFRSEFDRSQAKLTQAQEQFRAGSYASAEDLALQAQSTVAAALARVSGDRQAAAQFLNVDGTVEYQAAGGRFQRATVRTKLQKGDWVRTGPNSSAELFFADGSLYTVGPNALLEVYPAGDASRSAPFQSVKMQIGSIEVNTADDISTVTTPGTRIVVSSASTTLVGVNQAEATEVAAVRGSASIQSVRGGEALSLDEGQKLTASGAGDLSQVEQYVQAPALASPTDNAVIPASSGRIMELRWREVPSATGYRLQVSRSRLFGRTEIDAPRDRPVARVRLTSEGSFFWRVASVGPDGEVGPFSPHRRFRVTGIGDSPAASAGRDQEPPTLIVRPPKPFGGQFYLIEGRAEPGASVFVNDEEVQVTLDGSFRRLVSFNKVGFNDLIIKAVDPSGNQTIRRERILVEE